MSVIGTPIDTSLVQTAQAQQVAGKAASRQRARSDTTRRFEDSVELKVAGVEDVDAIRKLPQNESEQAEEEQRGTYHQRPDADRPSIDIQA